MNEQRTVQASPHFKPETSALVLIDHQVGTMQLIKNIASDVSLRNAVALAKAAKSFDMPILMTTSQEDHVQGPTADALQRVAPEAYAARIKRTGVVNPWSDPAFRDAVLGLGRRQLVMAAVTTDICLVFPAISAVEEGFEVQAVLDASESPFDVGEETSRRRMERAGVVGAPSSRIMSAVAAVIPPPPLAPAMASRSGSAPSAFASRQSQRQAASPSCAAAGARASGARR